MILQVFFNITPQVLVIFWSGYVQQLNITIVAFKIVGKNIILFQYVEITPVGYFFLLLYNKKFYQLIKRRKTYAAVTIYILV